MGFFADSTYGSDSNTGLSTSQPKKTLAAVLALLSTSGTQVLYLSGDFRNEQISLSSYSGLTIAQWPLNNLFPGDAAGASNLLPAGMTVRQARLRGDVLVTGSWSSIGNSVYTATIATGLTLSGLWYGWDTKAVDANGVHQGGMVLVASAAAVTTYSTGTGGAKGVFHYASGTGLITAYFGGDNPNSSGHAVGFVAAQATEAAFRFITCTNITVSGVNAALYPVYTTQYGWGVRWEGSRNCLVTGCTFDTMGAHIDGTLGGSGDSSGNTVANCIMRDLAPAGTHLIWHQNNSEGLLTGCVWTGNRIIKARYLGIDGLVMHGRGDSVAAFAANTQIGCYAHSDTGSTIAGVQGDQNVLINGEPALAAGSTGPVPFAADNLVAVSSANHKTRGSYAFTVDRTTITNYPYVVLGQHTGHIAVRRSYWISNLTSSGGFSSSGMMSLNAANASDYFWLWEECYFSCSLDGDGNETRMFNAQQSTGGTKRMVFINCTFYNSGTNTARFCGFFDSATEAVQYFETVGCIAAHRVTGTAYCYYIRDDVAAIPSGSHLDNLYWNIDTANGRYAQIAAYTAAQWIANVDTAATIGVNVLSSTPLADTATSALVTALQTVRRATSTVVPSAGGINGMAYAANFGDSQYPVPGALLGSGRPGRVKRVRRVKRA